MEWLFAYLLSSQEASKFQWTRNPGYARRCIVPCRRQRQRTTSGAENLGNGSPEQCFSFRKPPPWCAEKPPKHKRNKRRERVGARPPGKIVLCRASHRTRAQPGRNVSAAQSATLCHPVKSGQSAWYPGTPFLKKRNQVAKRLCIVPGHSPERSKRAGA